MSKTTWLVRTYANAHEFKLDKSISPSIQIEVWKNAEGITIGSTHIPWHAVNEISWSENEGDLSQQLNSKV